MAVVAHMAFVMEAGAIYLSTHHSTTSLQKFKCKRAINISIYSAGENILQIFWMFTF